MIELKQDDSLVVSELTPQNMGEKIAKAVSDPTNKAVEVVDLKNLEKRLAELKNERKEQGEVAQALKGVFHTNGNFSVDKNRVATFNKSKDRYQIMPNGAWVRLEE